MTQWLKDHHGALMAAVLLVKVAVPGLAPVLAAIAAALGTEFEIPS